MKKSDLFTSFFVWLIFISIQFRTEINRVHLSVYWIEIVSKQEKLLELKWNQNSPSVCYLQLFVIMTDADRRQLSTSTYKIVYPRYHVLIYFRGRNNDVTGITHELALLFVFLQRRAGMLRARGDYPDADLEPIINWAPDLLWFPSYAIFRSSIVIFTEVRRACA